MSRSSRLSRRSLLLAVGVSGAIMAMTPGIAVADSDDSSTDVELRAGESIDSHQASTLGPDQTATSRFTVNFRSLDVPLYANVYMRSAESTGGDRYTAALFNKKDALNLRLYKRIGKEVTTLGKIASIPLTNLPDAEAAWTVVVSTQGGRLLVTAESGAAKLTVQADDDSIVDGKWVVQNFYLSKTGSTATIRRTGLDQTSGGERADAADRDEASSTAVS